MGFKKSRILIGGLGLIGGSAAKALKQKGFSHISAYDRDEKTLNKAKNDGVIEEGFTELCGVKEKFDFVLCCLSPIYVLPLYKSAAPYLKEGGVFAEVGGIKSVMIRDLEEAMHTGHELLSLHPMAGSEKTGYEFSDKDMFADSVLVVTPSERTKGNAFEWAATLKKELGFTGLKELSAKDHDKIIADVSHIPHVVALCLKAMNTGTNNEMYAGGSYKSATRVAQINSSLWAGLMSDNKENLLASIEEFEKHLNILKEEIAKADYDGLKELLDKMSCKK